MCVPYSLGVSFRPTAQGKLVGEDSPKIKDMASLVDAEAQEGLIAALLDADGIAIVADVLDRDHGIPRRYSLILLKLIEVGPAVWTVFRAHFYSRPLKGSNERLIRFSKTFINRRKTSEYANASSQHGVTAH